MPNCRRIADALCVVLAATVGIAAPAMAAMPENLAAKAKTSATSEHNNSYLSRFAVDGKIPPAGSQGADIGTAWCILKPKSGDKADFTFEWKQPVEAAEIIYFGRTAWFMNEVWKDYEVYLDDAKAPVAKGAFKMIHGPQRVKFAKAKVSKITIKFLNSFGGMNPGAAEMLVFGQSPSDKDLAAWTKKATLKAPARRAPPAPAKAPRAGKVDREKVRALIADLKAIHGKRYAKAADHLSRLEKVEDGSEDLAKLQREVLLFDVDKLLAIMRYEITATHVYTYHYEGQRNGGGLYLISTRDSKAKPIKLVDSPKGQILDCDLSYDGRKVLFSWRRGMGKGYHLWTVDIDPTAPDGKVASNLKQLTDGVWHDYNACWLPDGGIAFLSTRVPQFAYCWHAPVGIVYRMNADGSNVSKLSANYLNDFTPYVLDDGRIIYSRWEYVDRPAIPIQSLWTINPDGTGMAGFFGNRVLTPGTFMEARSIPGTRKIICTMTGHNGPTRGAIGVIDPRKGLNAQEAIVNVTPDTPIGPINRGNGNTGGSKPYSCPVPLDRRRFLVSARGPALIRTIAGDCVSTALARPAGGMQWFYTQPAAARKRPPIIAHRYFDNEKKYATLYLQDVYHGLEPHVKRGEVKAIRVVRELAKPIRIDPSKRAFGFQFPVISCGATYAGKQVLGEVPLDEDGSAHFRVPANIPIYFMAIDAKGRAIQRMRSFTHLRPGEVQGCVGCHDRSTAEPPLLKPGDAFKGKPRDLKPMEWGKGGFDYSRIVQPVFDKYCIKCHSAVDPPKGIDLTGGKTDYFNVSYDVLAREGQGKRGTQYVNWIPTYNGQEWNILEVKPRSWGSPKSKLAEVVVSGHPNNKGKPRFTIDETSRRRVLAWIDLNVPYYGTSETAYPNNRGCRQILPPKLNGVLGEVSKRRCASCHKRGVPRRVWTRITEPELNPFLVAPLAKAAGGSEKCGKPIFKNTKDVDYLKILATFEPVTKMLKDNPRMDMPGAKPSPNVSRSCQ